MRSSLFWSCLCLASMGWHAEYWAGRAMGAQAETAGHLFNAVRYICRFPWLGHDHALAAQQQTFCKQQMPFAAERYAVERKIIGELGLRIGV